MTARTGHALPPLTPSETREVREAARSAVGLRAVVAVRSGATVARRPCVVREARQSYLIATLPGGGSSLMAAYAYSDLKSGEVSIDVLEPALRRIFGEGGRM